MVKYVYYDEVTKQVEAQFDTPRLAAQANWEAKGLTRVVIPSHLEVTRDYRIIQVKDGVVIAAQPWPNPVQPGPDVVGIINGSE